MAQGKYGTENVPWSSVTTDRVAYEPLTSDPSETYKGSSWFRDDLDSGDKIGTLRFQNDDAGSDIFDIPVFAEAESVDDVVKVRAIQTADGEGFIPMVQEGGLFDQLRFQHNSTWYGAHNNTHVTPPDAIAQFVAEDFDDTAGTWDSRIGSLTLSEVGSPSKVSNVLNGEAVVRLDGTSDGFTGAVYSSVISQPGTIYAVFDDAGTGSGNRELVASNGDLWLMAFETGTSDTMGIYGGSWIRGTTSAVQTPEVYGGFWDTTSSRFRRSGTEIESGDVGTNDMDELRVAVDNAGNAGRIGGDLAEIIVYDDELTTAERDYEEQRLASKYGITLA